MSKAKYVAISDGAKHRMWVRRFLNKLLPKQVVRKMEMLGDNKTSLTLTKDSKSQNRTKHIYVMHHHVQGLVKKGELGIEWIPSLSMLADGITKAFITRLFKKY